MLLVLPARERVEVALGRLLADPGLCHYALPPLWVLDGAGVDLPAALPTCRAVTLETLEDVLGTLLRLCDAALLDQLVRRMWVEVDERVRQYYLEMGIGQTLATIFKAAPRALDRAPPASFRRDRIHEHAFEVQYRLVPEGPADDLRAPPHEGSWVVYPFDPVNAAAREEHGLEPGSGAVVEIFAYESGRARHRAYWQGVAARERWTFVDPRSR